jgi:tetratricopeptide (TPR) repeat protein
MGKAKRRKRRSPEGKGIKRPVPEEKALPSLFTGRYGFAIAFSFITITALLIYSNTFSSPFLFDSKYHIVENNELRDLTNFWPPSGSRYVGFLSLAVNYRLGGLGVFGYHLVNIIIHIINGFLVWSLVVLTFRTPVMERAVVSQHLKYFIALVASIIFISHPLQTHAVTYIVQRFASLATLFYLLSLVLYIKARLVSSVGQGLSLAKQGPRVKTILLGLGSLVSAVLAMKTKEISFTLPFIILLYEFMFFGSALKVHGQRIRTRLLYLTPVVLTVLIIPLSLIGIDKPLGDIIGELREAAQETEAIQRGVYLITQFRVIVTYIRLLFLPVNQNLDYDYPHYYSLFEPGVFLSFLFLLSVFGLAIYLFIRSRKTGNGFALLASFGILWFFITLSVESSVIPIRDVIFEHRLYLPSVGAVVAFSTGVFYGFDYAKERLGIKVSPLLMTCILLFVTAFPLSLAAYNRNWVWKDGITLWEDVVRKSPEKARGHHNLGNAYNKRDLLDKAIAQYEETIRLRYYHPNAHNNLGVAYYKQGLTDEAIREYKEELRLRPDNAEAYYNLGFAYYKQGLTDEAIAEYKKALRLKPDIPEVHYNLGFAYYKQGRTDEAIAEYEEALRLRPDNPEVHNNLGLAYYKQGRTDEAIAVYKEAIRLRPDNPEAHNNLGNAYAKEGRTDEAIEEYRLALRTKPDYVKAYSNLGAVYARQGRMDEAIEEFVKALKLDPDFTDAHLNLGLAYMKKGLKDEAITEFEEVLKLNPQAEAARKFLQSLSR